MRGLGRSYAPIEVNALDLVVREDVVDDLESFGQTPRLVLAEAYRPGCHPKIDTISRPICRWKYQTYRRAHYRYLQ